MNIGSKDYNDLNGAQVRDAKELIDRIFQGGIQSASIIVDIGCGSGNVTSLLSQSIPHERLLAFDIDPKMVQFARETNPEKTEIFVQDISVPWDELNPLLQALEGTVDLVFSNRVLHWILTEKRQVAAENISRLLRPGGHFYTNTTCLMDPTKYLSDSNEPGDENLMNVPTKQKQEQEWRDFCLWANLSPSSISIKFVQKDWIYVTDKQFEDIFDAIMSYYRRYLPKEMDLDEKDRILAVKFREGAIKGTCTPFGEPASESNRKKRLSFYGQFQVKGTKL